MERFMVNTTKTSDIGKERLSIQIYREGKIRVNNIKHPDIERKIGLESDKKRLDHVDQRSWREG